MSAQGVIVALLVSACCIYAVWTLMPGAARRGVASWLLKLPLPATLARRFQRVAQAAAGCGCDGCDRADAARQAATAPPATQVIRFHPKLRR